MSSSDIEEGVESTGTIYGDEYSMVKKAETVSKALDALNNLWKLYHKGTAPATIGGKKVNETLLKSYSSQIKAEIVEMEKLYRHSIAFWKKGKRGYFINSAGQKVLDLEKAKFPVWYSNAGEVLNVLEKINPEGAVLFELYSKQKNGPTDEQIRRSRNILLKRDDPNDEEEKMLRDVNLDGLKNIQLYSRHTTNKTVSKLFDLYTNLELESGDGNTFLYRGTGLDDLLSKKGPARTKGETIEKYFQTRKCGVDPRDPNADKDSKVCIKPDTKEISSSIKFVLRLGLTEKSDEVLDNEEKKVLLENEEKLSYLAAPLKAFAAKGGGVLMTDKKGNLSKSPKKSTVSPSRSGAKSPAKSPAKSKPLTPL